MAEKAAIITGAGGGIGRAIALEMCRDGYRVALVGRKREPLEETAGICSDVLVHPADVTDPAAVDRLVAECLEYFGRVDLIVNNAGFAPLVGIDQITPQVWRQIIDTNLSAAVYMCRGVWPIFRRQGGGVIVNISSESARDPFVGLGAYGAAKAGLNLLGQALAQEGAAHNIRVHTVAPGAVETPMLRQIVGTEQLPTENTLSPDDVARMVRQCVSGELRHTSGEVIYIHKTA